MATTFWLSVGFAMIAGAPLLNGLPSLAGMQRVDGDLVKVYGGSTGRYSGQLQSELVIRTRDGSPRVFQGWQIPEPALSRLKQAEARAERASVWGRREYLGWPPFTYIKYWQVQVGDQIPLPYDPEETAKQRHRDLKLLGLSLAMAIGSLGVVMFSCGRQNERQV